MRTLRYGGMLIISLCALSLLATPAQAGGKFKTVAQLTASGGAKEVAVNRKISKIVLKCVEGTTIINTVVVREGGAKNSFTVARALAKGQRHVIELPSKRIVTGVRISDSKGGRYIVRVR